MKTHTNLNIIYNIYAPNMDYYSAYNCYINSFIKHDFSRKWLTTGG